MRVKKSFTDTACRLKIKIVYIKNYLKFCVFVKTRRKKTRVLTNFNKADYQIVTSLRARFLPVFLFFVLIICNTLAHSTLDHLKRAFIKKDLFSAKPFCFCVCIEFCVKTFFNPHARHSLTPTLYKTISSQIK